MKKTFALVLAGMMMCACLAGCGEKSDSDKAYIQQQGVLKVGITEYKPMDYKDENGQWIGFDAEFARLVGEKLGVQVEFLVLSDWGQKFYELETKNIDAIWNGMTITEEVRLNTSCTDPYVVNAQVVVMKKDAIDGYPDTESMKGLKFAVESGSAGEAALTELGIENIIALQDQAAAMMEVAAGTADACVIDITMANAMTGAGSNYADLAVGISLSSEEYGIGFRKDSDLTEEVNKIMDELIADGSLPQLAQEYNLTLAE